MITDKFKKIIFNKLTLDLSKVDIIFYDDSLWFIDRENEYWFLELQKGGVLYWRWDFFDHFFLLFTMERDEYEPLIKEWVESVLNCGVRTTFGFLQYGYSVVESVLNCGVTTTVSLSFDSTNLVESVLNWGVRTTSRRLNLYSPQMESVLNHGVTATVVERPSLSLEVESSLNNT
jgi:hypothetical protein